MLGTGDGSLVTRGRQARAGTAKRRTRAPALVPCRVRNVATSLSLRFAVATSTEQTPSPTARTPRSIESRSPRLDSVAAPRPAALNRATCRWAREPCHGRGRPKPGDGTRVRSGCRLMVSTTGGARAGRTTPRSARGEQGRADAWERDGDPASDALPNAKDPDPTSMSGDAHLETTCRNAAARAGSARGQTGRTTGVHDTDAFAVVQSQTPREGPGCPTRISRVY